MNGDFFVMLYLPSGSYTPLMLEDGQDIEHFETEEDARKAANRNVLGRQVGYEIFEIGLGVQ